MQEETYSHYNSISLTERRSGDFSDQSINDHHSVMKALFFEKMKKKSFTSAVNHLISFSLIALMLIGISVRHSFPLAEAFASIELLLPVWIIAFLSATAVRGSAYPTRKYAAENLAFLNLLEYGDNNPDFFA